MSSFNFSDNEDEEDEFDLEEFDETGLLAQASREREAAAAAAPKNDDTIIEASIGDSDGGDWDNVDWEDADEEDDVDNEEQPDVESFPREGVTIHIGRRVGKSNCPDEINEQEVEKKNDDDVVQDKSAAMKRRRKPTVRVLRNITPQTKLLVLNIRRTHLLCSMIHSMRRSFLCSSGGDSRSDVHDCDKRHELFNTALSLIPIQFHTVQHTTNDTFIIPTSTTVKQFCAWFFQFVNQAGNRRRRALGRNAAQGAATPTSAKKRRRRNSTIRPSRPSVTTTSMILRRLRHLSPCYDDEPQMFIEQERLDPIEAVEGITTEEINLLFLTMVRSMGWRARYVTALEPISLTLTVDHPLFKTSSSSPVASLDAKKPASGRKKRQKKSAAAAARSESKADTVDLVSSGEEDDEEATKNDLLSWIEVLQRKDKEEVGEKKEKDFASPTKKHAARWMPILVEQQTIDKPELVENILAWMRSETDNANKNSTNTACKGKWTSKKKFDRGNAHQFSKKLPVSYVIGVEHLSLTNTSSQDASCSQGVRFTDVTKRYANTWSRTLSLRGATAKDIKERGECVDNWFQTSLKKFNKHFKPETTEQTPPGKNNTSMKRKAKSPVRSVTKVKASNGKEVEVLDLESSDDEDKKPASKCCVDSSEYDDHEMNENEELNDNPAQEMIPKSKAAFKNHPFYVIQSVLSSKEVLHPDARKRICGVFKGELVYRRSDVSTALKAKKWLYEGRKVKVSEIEKPVKRVKARKKRQQKGFQALESYGITESAQDEAIASIDEKKDDDDEQVMDDLYGKWQTEPWSPPYVSPSDPIPTNEFKNAEKELLNPGLTHMEQAGLGVIARKLGVPYAPCMLGFERRGTPKIKGIVVHCHNVGLIREASVEWESHVAEKESRERQKQVVKRWKRLVVGLLTKERLERDYGSH
jgi:xeroderma pigmentosum group C-complementing protein